MSDQYNPSADELYTVLENTSGGERVFGYLGPRGMLENTSGGERVFGYLGPRGMRLAAGEVVVVPGDLLSSLGGLNQSGGRRRKFAGLERSLKNGSLRINSRPAPVLWDPVDERPKSLAIVGGALGTVDPTYTSSDSDSYAAV